MPRTPIRDDLTLAAYAIALGYQLRGNHAEPLRPDDFNPQGIPQDGLTFSRTVAGQTITIWQTARGWRVAALLTDGRYERPTDDQFHPRLRDALEAGNRRARAIRDAAEEALLRHAAERRSGEEEPIHG